MVVLLRYQEDLDPTDIAGLLNMPISTPARKGERSAKTLDAASTDAPGVFKWWPTGSERAQTLLAHQERRLRAAGSAPRLRCLIRSGCFSVLKKSATQSGK
jgi:hypothetical protein